MAKYAEKIPTMLVDISEWHPEKGLLHVAVAPERTPDGGWLGAIHRTNGDSIFGIKPGTFIVTYPTTPETYTTIKADEIDAFFELVDEGLPVLTADNGSETLADIDA